MKRILMFFCYFMLVSVSLMAEDVVGFWKTVNEKTSRPECILAVYEYNGKIFGRIIATYNPQGKIIDSIENPKERAPGVAGDAYYCGLDIIWNLQKKGDKYINGHIMDPEKGRIYNAEMWRDGRHLVVRGKILFFGRNQTWPPAMDSDFPPGFKKPDLASLVPSIPKVK